jgi:LemA protein
MNDCSRQNPAYGRLRYFHLVAWRPGIIDYWRHNKNKIEEECPMKRFRTVLLLFCMSALMSGCGYNSLNAGDEKITAAWAEVVNQYQRRADLIPNLVRTVEGFAKQEREVLIGVTEARSKVSSIQVSPEMLDDPAALQQFQAAQGELSGALSRLLVTVEKYPDLKSDQNFRDLQAQLEGTENRITVARNRFIESVREYNTTVRSFPTNLTAMIFGFDVKPTFSVENEAEIAKPPEVDFGSDS